MNNTNLPENHPLIQFAKNPEVLEKQLALDDVVVMGAMSLMKDAEDALLSDFSKRILYRQYYKCIDITERIKQNTTTIDEKKLEAIIVRAKKEIENWSQEHPSVIPRILQDEGTRSPYKEIDKPRSNTPMNQIMIRHSDKIVDIRDCSHVIRAIPTFNFHRIYIDGNNKEARQFIDNLISKINKEGAE